MPKSSDAPLPEAGLDALIAVIAAEARANPDFARRLRAALDGSPQPDRAHAETTAKRPETKSETKTQAKAATEPAAFHAVVVLREDGAAMLRGRLERLATKTALRAVAKRSGLRLTGDAAKRSASVAEIVDGIVRAAEHYDAQRTAAAR